MPPEGPSNVAARGSVYATRPCQSIVAIVLPPTDALSGSASVWPP